MKAADLREKSVEDLRELEKTLAHDVFQNRLKNFTNRLDDTSAMRKAKRELARVATVLREAQLGIIRATSATPVAATSTVAAPSSEEGAPKKKSRKKSEAKQS
jgi:large subunit ribosomal protein L29